MWTRYTATGGHVTSEQFGPVRSPSVSKGKALVLLEISYPKYKTCIA